MEVRPLPQQRHPLMHALHPPPQQQFDPSHPQLQAAPPSLNTPPQQQQQRAPMPQPASSQQPHYGVGLRSSPLPGSVNSGSLAPSLIGQKRDSSGITHGPSQFGGFADSTDSGNFAKLFVGSVPRNTTEEEVRGMFNEFGNVTEVALIRDKRTGLQQDTRSTKTPKCTELQLFLHTA